MLTDRDVFNCDYIEKRKSAGLFEIDKQGRVGYGTGVEHADN